MACSVSWFLPSSSFFLSSSSVSSGHRLDPTAGHHVTNRAVLQRVFQMVVVWVQNKDWRAGLSRLTGNRTHPAGPAAHNGARQHAQPYTGNRTSSLLITQAWGWRGQTFLFQILSCFVFLAVLGTNSFLTDKYTKYRS